MLAALCHPCQMACNLVCLLCITIRLPVAFHSRRSHKLSSASPASRATGQKTYSSSSCSFNMPKGFWWQWRLVHEEPNHCLLAWQRAPGALRRISYDRGTNSRSIPRAVPLLASKSGTFFVGIVFECATLSKTAGAIQPKMTVFSRNKETGAHCRPC
jgi:hypothetical protein